MMYTSIKQLTIATLLANTMQDPLSAYYSLWGAKELSPSNDLLEEFTCLPLDYDFKELPFLTWVNLEGFSLKSSGHAINTLLAFANNSHNSRRFCWSFGCQL